MVDVAFKFNGEIVNPNTISDILTRTFIESLSTNLQVKLQEMKCPFHHEYPRVIAEGNSAKELSYRVTGCCDHLVNSAQARLLK